MEKVIRYKCEKCGKLFENEAKCIQHEDRHLRVGKANEMLEAGHTLMEIQDECSIWDSVPEHLENVTKDNCFEIPYWGCDKPVYKIVNITLDGCVGVYGYIPWNGWFGGGTTKSNFANALGIEEDEHTWIVSKDNAEVE